MAKKIYDDLLITLKKEEIRHLKEFYNTRMSKLSPDVLAMMNADTTAKTKPQELCKPSDVVASPRVISLANARNTIPDPWDTYLAPQGDIQAGGRGDDAWKTATARQKLW